MPYNVAGIVTAMIVCGLGGYALKMSIGTLGVPLYVIVCLSLIACFLTIAHLSDRRQAARQREDERSARRAAD